MRAGSTSASAAATSVSRCNPVDRSTPWAMRADETTGVGPGAVRVGTVVFAPHALVSATAAIRRIRYLLTTRSYERTLALASVHGLAYLSLMAARATLRA